MDEMLGNSPNINISWSVDGDEDEAPMIPLCMIEDIEGTIGSSNQTYNASKPYIGMKFNSHEEAYDFYNAYGLLIGFGIRRSTTNYSRMAKKVPLDKKFVCNKEGHKSINDKRNEDKIVNHRRDTRVGCSAMMRIKLLEDGKWHMILIQLGCPPLINLLSCCIYPFSPTCNFLMIANNMVSFTDSIQPNAPPKGPISCVSVYLLCLTSIPMGSFLMKCQRILLRLIMLLYIAMEMSCAINANGEALLSFKKSIVGSDGVLRHWRPEAPDPCKWKGVTCGRCRNHEGHQQICGVKGTNIFAECRNHEGHQHNSLFFVEFPICEGHQQICACEALIGNQEK